MPLPGQGTLSLHGYSRIGDTTTTEPKTGMIIRMTPETLEALQDSLGQPNLEVEMSDKPGLWIGEKFFPMQSQSEPIAHELYLRTSTAAKPNAPLKLQANVIGKFIIAPKLERIQNKMRDTQAAADRLKEERQIQLLPEPPVLPPKPGTRKAKATSTKKSAKTGAGTANHSRVPPKDRSATPNLPPGEEAYRIYGDPSTRRRLIHCIALQPRDTAEVMRLVAGRDVGPQEKKELTEILKTCAVWRAENGQGPDAKRTWHLMTRTWTEIRPYEWERLSDDERTRLARECRKHYAILKIPESDPQWDHARYRDLSRMNVASSSAPGPEPKRGITSGTVKKKKAAEAPSRRANDAITARDERIQPNRSRPDPSPAHAGSGTVVRAAPRKPPGSGYKSKAGSNTPSPPDLDSFPPVPSSLPRKPEFPSTPHAPSSHDRVPSSSSSPDKSSTRLPPKPRESVQSSSHSHAPEVKTERQEISFKRKAPVVRDEHETEMSDRDRDRPKPMLKRRKIGDVNGSSSTSTPAHQRAPSLPNKPSTATQDAAARPPSRSIKKEPSPMPSLSLSRSPLPPARSPLAHHHHKVSTQDRIVSSASSSSTLSRQTQPAHSSHRSGSSKIRRKSPIYTSSENEEAPLPKPSRSAVPPAPTSPIVSSASPKKARRPRDNGPLKLPDDERSLKKLYNERYKPYMMLWTKHYKAHSYIKKLLEDEDASSESDVDVDIDNHDELRQLKQDLDAAVEELSTIQEHYNKIVRSKRSEERYSDEE